MEANPVMPYALIDRPPRQLFLAMPAHNVQVLDTMRHQRDLTAIDIEIEHQENLISWYRRNYMQFIPDFDTATEHQLEMNSMGLESIFLHTMLINRVSTLRQDVQVDLAREAFEALCIKAGRQARAEKEASETASSPKRVRLEPDAQASPPVMTLSESLAHADPWLLRRIVNMACDCREDGTPLSMVAKHEWSLSFEAH